MSDNNILKLRSWLRELSGDPIQALETCKESFGRTEESRNKKLYASLGFLAAFVESLSQSSPAREAFLKHQFWAGNNRIAKRPNLALLAARFVLGAKDAKGALYEQARSYGQVTDHFLFNKMPPIAIPAELERETISGIIDRIKSRPKKKSAVKAKAVDPSGDTSSLSDEEVSSDDADESEDSGDTTGSSSESESQSDESDIADTKNDGSLLSIAQWNQLHGEVKEIVRQELMPVLLAVRREDFSKTRRYVKGGLAKLYCEGEAEDGWLVLRCTKVRRS